MRISCPGFSRKQSDLKRAFTLIELLVIIAIMGLMVTVGIVSVRSGQDASRIKGATRDIFASIRQARSIALVTQRPAIITYSTGESDGEVVAKVEITSAKLMDSGVDLSKVRTVTGQPLKSVENVASVAVAADNGADKGAEGDAKPEGGEGSTLEEVLFAPIDEDVVKGVRVKVIVGEGSLETSDDAPRPRISVFSNVDYLLGKFKEARKAEEGKKDEGESAMPDPSPSAASASAVEPPQEPVSVVWESNGRVEPHKVWIYADGKRPESGLCIKVDSFGAAKVVSGDGREDG